MWIIYPWSSNFLENFSVSVIWMKVSKCWKIVEFAKISSKMKNYKTYYKAQTASHLKEIIQLPTREKLPTPLEQKLSYKYIQQCTDMCYRSASRTQVLSVWKWCSANVFSVTNQKHVCWKVCKLSKVLSLLRHYIFYNVKWGEV